MDSSLSSYRDRYAYRIRLLVSMAAVLSCCIGLVRWWPAGDHTPVNLRPEGERETVDITVVQQTVQGRRQPLPPPPEVQAPPIEVPDDVTLPDEELDLSLPPERPPGEGTARRGTAGEDSLESPGDTVRGQPPRPARLVEPNYTAEARDAGVRARIVVEVLVNPEGYVEERRIVQRHVVDEGGRTLEPVEEVGYGLEEAALTAAKDWRFRPGRRNGEAVSTYTQVTFSFGF